MENKMLSKGQVRSDLSRVFFVKKNCELQSL